MEQVESPRVPGPEFDHGSDPNFVDYYAQASLSEETYRRFRTVRDKAIALLAAQGTHGKPLRVADIGCGAGTQAFLWAELGHEVRALDVNAPLIEVARARAAERNLRIQFDVGSATALPYPSASFHACLLPELLEHVEDWQSCLREAVRVLMPGGVLYLSTTNALCPKQSEFNLPAYSWYPSFLKRRYERLALSSRPDLANYAKYPAVHWFTFGSLESFLNALDVQCFDRVDLVQTEGRSLAVRLAVQACRVLPPAKVAARFFIEGTTIFAVKRGANREMAG